MPLKEQEGILRTTNSWSPDAQISNCFVWPRNIFLARKYLALLNVLLQLKFGKMLGFPLPNSRKRMDLTEAYKKNQQY